MKDIKKSSGRPLDTWVSLMKKHLQDIGVTWENTIEFTKNRGQWIGVYQFSILSNVM